MWTVRINGHPTVRCTDEATGVRAYEELKHWKVQGHTVALWVGRRQVMPLEDGGEGVCPDEQRIRKA